MENINNENPNIDIAIQVQRKFEFYLVALVFTILGLSVQTSTITGQWQCFFEIASLVMLLVSGLAGLSRLEWTSVAHKHAGWLQKEENVLKIFNEGLRGRIVLGPSGERWSMEKLTEEKTQQQEHISKRKNEKEMVEKQLEWKYSIHKWCFAAGVCLLLISRIIVSVNKL